MNRIGNAFRAKVVVPRGSIWLLAAGCFLAILALFFSTRFAQAQAETSDARAECRSRVVGFIAGVEQERDSNGWDGLLDAVDKGDIPDEKVTRTKAANELLRGDLKTLRETVTEVCTANPNFDPATHSEDSP